MFDTLSASSLHLTLMIIGGVLVFFSASAFVIIGSLLIGDGKWHVTLMVLFTAAVFLWALLQHMFGINLRPALGHFGG